MPLQWQLDGDIFVVTVVGAYGLEDFDRVAAELQADPRFRPGLSFLFDARESETPISTPFIDGWWKRVASLAALGFCRRCAIVVKEGEPHRFGMARVAAGHLLAKGVELTVARDIEMGRAALRRPST